MARSFVAASSHHLSGSFTIPGYPVTMACHVRTGTSGVVQQIMVADNGTANERLGLRIDTSGNLVLTTTAGGVQGGTTSGVVSDGEWHRVVMAALSATSRSAFVDTVGSKATTVINLTPTVDRFWMATRVAGATENLNGDLAFAAIWSVALSDPEVDQFLKGAHPMLIRPDTLWSFWDIRGDSSPEPDGMAAGRNLAIGGGSAPLKSANPPLIYFPTGVF